MSENTLPEFVAEEKNVLQMWSDKHIFDRLVGRNQGGPKYSFIDGPITANNMMGVHHAWGRTLKDVLQRYWALKGYDQRFQNGFDCQGLWVEVEVEKAMNIGSRAEIETMGLETFSRLCRERVEKYSLVQMQQSIRLGQWMDWNNNYFTMSDANNLFIWNFLKLCNDRGWIYRGHRPMPWCPRCGTSLSQHELGEGFKQVTHDGVFLLFPLLDADDEYLLVWTTTPWTLTANTAAAVNPMADYIKVRDSGRMIYLAKALSDTLKPGFEIIEGVRGEDLVGRRYRGPFAELKANKDVEYRVVDWSEVSIEEGTGIVHIAPGCGPEDYELGKQNGLSVVSPIDENGVFWDGFGNLAGNKAWDVSEMIFANLKDKGLLYKIEPYEHSYAHCWRDNTPLVYRLVGEWFIDPDRDFGDGRTVREHILEAADKIFWAPAYVKSRMRDWLENMQSWCISRKRFWGLPLPFYVGEGDSYYVVGSIEELQELAIDEDKQKVADLPEIHRPWIDDIRIRHPETGETMHRVSEVGDCWLDAGIVPFSTLGYKDLIPYERYKTEQDKLNKADSRSIVPEPSYGHEYWKEWFPAESICEMRAQTRGWFYSLLFMSVALEDRTPYLRVYTYEDVRDEQGEEMHKSKGNAIWFDDAVERVGADPMRWLYATQNPAFSLNFGYGPIRESTRKLLDIWNIYKFFNTYAVLDKPNLTGIAGCSKDMTDIDRWLVSRLQKFVEDARMRYESFGIMPLTKLVEEFIDDISNWYVRRNRRRFWKSTLNANKRAAYETLGHVLTTLAQVISPIVPFMAEQMYLGLAEYYQEREDSVHLLRFPEPVESLRDEKLEAAVDSVREVVSLALSARASVNIRVRQVLSQLILRVPEGVRAHVEQFEADVKDEVNINEIVFVDSLDEYRSLTVKPNFASLKNRLAGAEFKDAIDRIKTSDPNALVERVRSGEDRLTEEDLLVEYSSKDGFSVETSPDFQVALDIRLDDNLKMEGYTRDLVRHIQRFRRELGLEVDRRINLGIQAPEPFKSHLKQRTQFIADEVLARNVDMNHGAPGERNSTQVDLGDYSLTVTVDPIAS